MRNFISKFGLKAYRRPLSNAERDRHFDLYTKLKPELGDTGAVQALVQTFLVSPNFLYLVDDGEAAEGEFELSDYEIASRMSYLAWDSMPDDELLAAAGRGELKDSAKRVEIFERMLKDDKAKVALDNFNEQWLGIDSAEALADSMNVGPNVANNNLNALNNFLQDWFFNNRPVSQLYTKPFSVVGVKGVDLSSINDIETSGGQSQINAGILGSRAFISSHTNPGGLAPVPRGVAVLENLLCTEPPPAPDDVPDPPEIADNTTNRDWLALHNQAGSSCIVCHNLFDPLGLAFEQFDDRGRIRGVNKAGSEVDTSAILPNLGDLSGSITGLVDLAEALSESDLAQHCVAEFWYRTALGRTIKNDDHDYLDYLVQQWKNEGGSSMTLLSKLVATDLFITRIKR